jgi:hypothetical protein
MKAVIFLDTLQKKPTISEKIDQPIVSLPIYDRPLIDYSFQFIDKLGLVSDIFLRCCNDETYDFVHNRYRNKYKDHNLIYKYNDLGVDKLPASVTERSDDMITHNAWNIILSDLEKERKFIEDNKDSQCLFYSSPQHILAGQVNFAVIRRKFLQKRAKRESLYPATKKKPLLRDILDSRTSEPVGHCVLSIPAYTIDTVDDLIDVSNVVRILNKGKSKNERKLQR